MARWLTCLLLTLSCSTLSAQGSRVRWEAKFKHYTPAESPDYYAWQILVAGWRGVKSDTPAASFEATVNNIFAADKRPRITSIALSNISEMDSLRENVINYLINYGAIAPAAPNKPMRWKLRNGAEGRIQLVTEAILHSGFVASLDRVLQKRGERIVSLQLEKLLLALDEKPPTWLAMVWLDVDK
jgi:hypothetical protein